MRRTPTILLAAALAFGTIAAGEGEDLSDHPCYDAETDTLAYDEQQVWFHEGDAKLGNTAAAPWDTTPPATSVQGGAGAGALSGSDVIFNIGGEDGPGATFAGTFEGCIDTLLFDVYSFDPTNRSGTSGSAIPSAHNFSMVLTVDGVELVNGGPYAANTTHSNEGMGPNLNQFSVDLGSLMELYAGLDMLELDGEHTIEVQLRAWYVNTGAAAVYVWDTTEVPSGMTFNGEATEEYPGVA